jgi:hypothetical protein
VAGCPETENPSKYSIFFINFVLVLVAQQMPSLRCWLAAVGLEGPSCILPSLFADSVPLMIMLVLYNGGILSGVIYRLPPNFQAILAVTLKVCRNHHGLIPLLSGVNDAGPRHPLHLLDKAFVIASGRSVKVGKCPHRAILLDKFK